MGLTRWRSPNPGETVEVDGKPMVTPEVLVFDVTGDGRIGRVEIFIQMPAG
jgi:hypothetical protein